MIEVGLDGIDTSEVGSARHVTLTGLARLFDYSIEISAVVERVVGQETSGNDDINVLAALAAAGSATTADLMRLTSLPRARLSRAVDRLESKALVAREPSPRDRRMRTVVLVEHGRRQLGSVDHELRRWFHEHADDATEVVALIAPHVLDRPHVPPTDTLAVVGQMGAAGGAWVQAMLRAGAPHSPRQRAVLAMLANAGALRPRELADRLDITSGGVTYLVDQMAAAGLVERAYGVLADDRRAVVIRLAPAGRAGVDAMAAALDAHADAVASALVASTYLTP